jgi:hypothetical protein
MGLIGLGWSYKSYKSHKSHKSYYYSRRSAIIFRTVFRNGLIGGRLAS